MEMVKQEMKSYVWVQTADGSIQQLEEEVAMFCPMICREILQKASGSSKNNAIILPERVNPSTLGLVLDYCHFHQLPGHSNKERKAFDEKFIRLDTKKLCELTSAADSLQLKPLVDLTSRSLARIIEGKTAEEIREIFNLPDDLTEEEKLEPLKNVTDDPRIRLLNRLYARKRKELKERGKMKSIEAEEEHVDERSVDDLLSFINGEDKDSKGSKAGKSKKKNHRKKEHLKASASNSENGSVRRECEGTPGSSENGDQGDNSASMTSLNSQDHVSGSLSPKPDFDDGDIDDEMDPEMKEQLDREVEDFARRLNATWPKRVKELLSLGQDRGEAPICTRGNSSVQSHSNKALYQQYNEVKP